MLVLGEKSASSHLERAVLFKKKMHDIFFLKKWLDIKRSYLFLKTNRDFCC